MKLNPVMVISVNAALKEIGQQWHRDQFWKKWERDKERQNSQQAIPRTIENGAG